MPATNFQRTTRIAVGKAWATATPEQRFGPGWFWPALKRYRGMLLQVLLASFVVQLFSLANPLLIQVIIDKVISQRSLDTLQQVRPM